MFSSAAAGCDLNQSPITSYPSSHLQTFHSHLPSYSCCLRQCHSRAGAGRDELVQEVNWICVQASFIISVDDSHSSYQFVQYMAAHHHHVRVEKCMLCMQAHLCLRANGDCLCIHALTPRTPKLATFYTCGSYVMCLYMLTMSHCALATKCDSIEWCTRIGFPSQSCVHTILTCRIVPV